MSQPAPTLFRPDDLEPPRCTAKDCDAGTRKNLCQHDADISEGLISATRKRPKTCLNAYNPATAEIPF